MRALPALLVLCLLLAGCLGQGGGQLETPTASPEVVPTPSKTPLPVRTPHAPGEIVEYVVQSGDTLTSVAAHFHTRVEEILAANPEVPAEVTTLPPGYPLRVPAYFVPLTGSTFHILPDSEVVYSLSVAGFDVRQEILKRPGFLAGLQSYAYGVARPAWEVVDVVARMYSVHPRLLLALLEYRTHALTSPYPEGTDGTYPIGYRNPRYSGLFRQLIWAAELINDGFYGWMIGTLEEFELADGYVLRPDPWQNAGTVGLHVLFAGLHGMDGFNQAVSPEGFYRVYEQLWGDPFEKALVLIPGDLRQPELSLPFEIGHTWTYTSGPHYSWGTSLPFGALDFGPPAAASGCQPNHNWVLAPAGGVIARSGEASVVLDLDGDGDETTGWVIFFFHMATEDRVAQGTIVDKDDPLGHPSCEGGQATGAHVHVARKYNGQWISADGPLPFVLGGWAARQGSNVYEGTLARGSSVVVACVCSDEGSQIRRLEP